MSRNHNHSISAELADRLLLLVSASKQAYSAFSEKAPRTCNKSKIKSPLGYDFWDCWTGVDSSFSANKTVEQYGVVFRSHEAPYSYIFAFRGTSSLSDAIDDLGAELTPFVPQHGTQLAEEVLVEAGFWDVYTNHCHETRTPCMRDQLFALVDQYSDSDAKIGKLLVTGHSLGAALSQLFTLDLALCRPGISTSNINFASPRVGNAPFVEFYEASTTRTSGSTKTLRVHNTYDKIPNLPPVFLGFSQIKEAYSIAFYRDETLGEFDLPACHAIDNYLAVLDELFNNDSNAGQEREILVPELGYRVKIQ